jgi:hypothetical protein
MGAGPGVAPLVPNVREAGGDAAAVTECLAAANRPLSGTFGVKILTKSVDPPADADSPVPDPIMTAVETAPASGSPWDPTAPAGHGVRTDGGDGLDEKPSRVACESCEAGPGLALARRKGLAPGHAPRARCEPRSELQGL